MAESSARIALRLSTSGYPLRTMRMPVRGSGAGLGERADDVLRSRGAASICFGHAAHEQRVEAGAGGKLHCGECEISGHSQGCGVTEAEREDSEAREELRADDGVDRSGFATEHGRDEHGAELRELRSRKDESDVLQRDSELLLEKDGREGNEGAGDDAPDREDGKESPQVGMEDEQLLTSCRIGSTKRERRIGNTPSMATAAAPIRTRRIPLEMETEWWLEFRRPGSQPPMRPEREPVPIPVANEMLKAKARLSSVVSPAIAGAKQTGQLLIVRPMRNAMAICMGIHGMAVRNTATMGAAMKQKSRTF